MTDGALFGLELQRERERRGLSLDHLAEATKISASLFAGLERSDLSRWPGGIFRRAFVRGYAQAVGLSPDETVARFLRVYPEPDASSDGAGTVPQAPSAPEPADSTPRLMLAETAASARSTGAWLTARRVGAPVVDLLLAGVPALVASAIFGWQWFFVAAALVGIVGHLLALGMMGTTPGGWLLLPRPPAARRATDADSQARRRAEADAVAPTPRRRQPRHASGAQRPMPAGRARHAQH
jgi:transcriptional regulator with XRE-family HTH domain